MDFCVILVCFCLNFLCGDCFFFFFQAEDGIRDAQESRGLGDVYKRQESILAHKFKVCLEYHIKNCKGPCVNKQTENDYLQQVNEVRSIITVSYTHLRAHETPEYLVCRLLLEQITHFTSITLPQTLYFH